DAPIERPPTPEEREDFARLVELLAGVYRPYLGDQLRDVAKASEVSEELLDGKLDCFADEDAMAALFERLASTEAARYLPGEAAFKRSSAPPAFARCRCLRLCGIRFGCCLARSRPLLDVLRCVIWYCRCIRLCFQPLRCELTAPEGCTVEEPGLLPDVSPIA